VLLDAIEFLGGTPNPQSLCRHLTLNVAAEARPIGALICVLETSGSLRIAGSFGLDEQSLAAFAEQTAADLSPLAEAIRSGQPTLHARAAGIRELFPEFSSRGFLLVPTAIWPISSRGERIGAIQLFFDEHSMESPLTADFEAIVALFALYVRLQLATGVSQNRWATAERRHAYGAEQRGEHGRTVHAPAENSVSMPPDNRPGASLSDGHIEGLCQGSVRARNSWRVMRRGRKKGSRTGSDQVLLAVICIHRPE
jgi:hypothetical protein